MKFEWDQLKAATNKERHGVDFADTVAVFEDMRAITIDDPHPDEPRFVTIGMDFLMRVLLVSYTWRGDAVRIISARKATKKERKQYEVGL